MLHVLTNKTHEAWFSLNNSGIYMNIGRMSSVLVAFAKENNIANIRVGGEILSFEECGEPGMGMMAAYSHCLILSEYLPEGIRSCLDRVKLKKGGAMSLYEEELDSSDTDRSDLPCELPCAYIVLSMMMTSLTLLNERHFDILSLSERNAPLPLGGGNLSYLDRFFLDISRRKAVAEREWGSKKTEIDRGMDPEMDLWI